MCLGATAARAIFNRPVTIGEERGRVHEHEGRRVVLTVHPSAIVRVRDADDRSAAFTALVADLRLARESSS